MSPRTTPRIRLLLALALVALLTVPAGVAYAGQRSSADLAAETSSSIFQASSTTNAPTTVAPTTAPTTAPPTTEAPPVTEPPTTAPPVTEAPATTTPPTTAAPAPAPTAPPTTKAPVAPPTTAAPTYVRTYPTASAEEWERAMAFAHIVKSQQDADWAAAHPAGEPAPPEPAPVPTDDPLQTLSIYDQQFFQCVRWRESRGNYGAVNPSSGAGGAYQMLQSTWNNTAAHAGRGDLIGVRPNYASVYDQDFLAVHLLKWYGRSPWAGPGC